MFGTSSSPTSTGTIAEPSTTSNVAVDVTGPRSVTISPVPVANGACTSSCAVWPGRYSSASGTMVSSSLRDGAARDRLGAAHPAGRLAAADPSGVVGDGGGDPVGAARRRCQGARRRLGRRGDRAGCRVEQLVGPLPVDEAAVRPPGDDVDLASGDGGTVDVGDDHVDREVLALADEGVGAAEPDVEVGGVDEQVGRAGDHLAVDVLHGGVGAHRDRQPVEVGVEVADAQVEVVRAGGVGAAR